MTEDYGAAMPCLAHARSYYAELDIVGLDPVYVTGSLYEYKGGPLVARVPTLIDTNAQDLAFFMQTWYCNGKRIGERQPD